MVVNMITPSSLRFSLSGCKRRIEDPSTLVENPSNTETEFSQIRSWERTFRPTQTFSASLRESNVCKNRYQDVLPYDSTRVRLQTPASDYINASHISLDENSFPFIACQAPISSTFYDFWWMVYEQNSAVIVTLTDLVENNRVKANRFWPTVGERMRFGNLVVRFVKSKEYRGTPVNCFSLSLLEDNFEVQERTIYHLNFTQWGDMGVPSSFSSVQDLAKLMGICYQGGVNAGASGPIIVHCSAGIGRTGTFIAISHLLQVGTQSAYRGFTPSTFDVVKSLRSQRMGMVQTQEQYSFIQECVLDFLNNNQKTISLKRHKRYLSDPTNEYLELTQPRETIVY